ncbi:putative RNA-directed DNA polymerase [Helianthus annuus]|nr:putative RNA-directed DNA polymerase [Helianthus annuus]
MGAFCSSMNLMSINIRGVIGSGKPSWIRRLKREWRFSFLGIQETHQAGLMDSFWFRFWDKSLLESVSVDAIGRSGGLACLWDPGIFSAANVVKNQNFLLITGHIIGVNEPINLLNVYAPNDSGKRRLLWAEISALKLQFPGLWLAFGDFNEVRQIEDRVNSKFDALAAATFNDFILSMDWHEHPMSGGSFTFISNHQEVKLSKLDRFLVCDRFMGLWPLAKVSVLSKGLSDHCPIFLSCINNDYGPPPFKFYNTWLDDKEVEGIIIRSVGNLSLGDKGDVALANCLKNIKKDLKSWKQKSLLIENKDLIVWQKTLEDLETLAESAKLNDTEKKLRVNIISKIKDLEVKRSKDWQQKARANWLKNGDDNTSFFHNMVNLNKANRRINGLLVNGVWESEPKVVMEELRKGFKKQFSEPMRRRPTFSNIGLHTITDEQGSRLVVPFSSDEIFQAIHECDGGKAPGPDGFTLKFYKRHWSLLKPALVKMMSDFHETGEISRGCNASFIALIPKSSDPQVSADYRPISLVGSIYKIISKVLAGRLKDVMSSLVSPTQSAFVGGRYILDSPLIVGETIAWAKKHKCKMMIFKVDFQRAYDSLNWKFLFKVMEYLGFPDKWVKWISGCLKSGRGSVLVNGSPSNEFQYKRGLRQGDPISPFLFILALEVLVMFVNKAVKLGLFHGVKLPNDGPVLSHLCYADDVLFIGEWSDHNAVSLKRLLRCLFLVSGLKVNEKKCHLFGVGVDETEVARLARVLNCETGKFPFYYLGIPIGANMKRSIFWRPIVEKFKKKLSGWKARHLSLAGRVTLAKSVLGSLPSYFLSLFPAPKCIIKQLEGIRRDFVWGKTGQAQKMRWVRWKCFMKPKTLGGVGVGGINDFNLAMLSKWW